VKVQATVVLEDPDLGPLSVLVEAEVTLTAPRHHGFGRARVLAAAMGGHPATGLTLRSGQATHLCDIAQDLVDRESNTWRIWEVLAEAYDEAQRPSVQKGQEEA